VCALVTLLCCCSRLFLCGQLPPILLVIKDDFLVVADWYNHYLMNKLSVNLIIMHTKLYLIINIGLTHHSADFSDAWYNVYITFQLIFPSILLVVLMFHYLTHYITVMCTKHLWIFWLVLSICNLLCIPASLLPGSLCGLYGSVIVIIEPSKLQNGPVKQIGRKAFR
jgi:hypothetical protein